MEAVRIATWKVAYRGLLPDALLDGLEVRPARVAEWERSFDAGESELLVAVAGAEVVGFSGAGPCRDEDRPEARELYGLYVAEALWGTGTGHALLAGQEPLDVVWVLEGNSRAIGFYARHGFRPDGTTKAMPRLAPDAVELRMSRDLG